MKPTFVRIYEKLYVHYLSWCFQCQLKQSCTKFLVLEINQSRSTHLIRSPNKYWWKNWCYTLHCIMVCQVAINQNKMYDYLTTMSFSIWMGSRGGLWIKYIPIQAPFLLKGYSHYCSDYWGHVSKDVKVEHFSRRENLWLGMANLSFEATSVNCFAIHVSLMNAIISS